MKKIIYGVSILMGTIVGVGIFGLPYLAYKTGFLLFLIEFLFLTVFVLIFHLLWVKIILSTPGKHRLPGYGEFYFGKLGKFLGSIVVIFTLFGANLAYLIVGGEFISGIFNQNISAFLGGIIFFILGSLAILIGIKPISKTELGCLIVFLFILGILGVVNIPQINLTNFNTLNISKIFLPYGAIIFSLWGSSILPEVKEYLKDRKKFIITVIISILIAMLTYLFFVIIVLGVVGSNIQENALLSLKEVTPSYFYKFLMLFGFITCFSSYLTLGLTLKKVFWFDYKFPHFLSFILATVIPFSLFIFGITDFIEVINKVGAYSIGIEGLLVCLIFYKISKDKKVALILETFLIIILLIGIITRSL